MSQDTADVTIHIDETLDHSRLTGVAGSLREVKGVVSVTSHEDKPHLMVVVYDPEQTTSSALLEVVTGQGYHAELIGL